MNLFAELDATTGGRDKILKFPLPYPGNKNRCIEKILPYLPYRGAYVEPFGGTGVILLNREQSKLEVYNDRFGGIADFYRCLNDAKLYAELREKLQMTIHSRELFVEYKKEWDSCDSITDRAFKWYYMMRSSFGTLGRNWARSTSSVSKRPAIRYDIPGLDLVHHRLGNVQIENLDWECCIKEYDSYDTVFYCDPPYMNTDLHIYKHKFDINCHKRLLSTLKETKGFVAVSGYANEIYDACSFWDDRIAWDVYVSIKSQGGIENNKEGIIDARQNAEEVLWIKY